MAFAITGAKYAAASVSAVGTSTVTVSTAPFVQADFAKQRLVGLWTSGAVFKGMTWARRWVSTSQIELEKPFFDPATGQAVTQAVGDQVLVSKDFSESAVAGLAVSGRVVSITDTCTFGVNGNQMGVCLYDENKLVNATVGTLLSGGLVVFGKLDDYATDSVSASVDIQSSAINPLLCNDAAVNFCGYGGRWESSAAPAYFIGGANQGTAGQTVVLNGVECPNDLLTNSAGGAWARNPTRHQLVNCYSITTGGNAIMRRWGNGIIRGGRYKFPNNTSAPISVFGSDAAGTYTVAANPNDRAVVLDMGNGPALVRNSSAVAMTFNFTNLITTDFRSVTGISGGLNPNPNGTNTFRFSDTYTNLQAGTVGVLLNNSGAVADSVASSNSSWSPSLLRRTCVGATVTVNATSWTFGFKKYGFQAVGGTIAPSTYDLGTAGQADNVAFGGAVNQLADAGVTLTQSAAAALTQINTLDQFYDAGINWGTVSTSNAQYPSLGAYPVSFAGTVLDLGSRNLIVDGTAAQAFAINTSTHTITIKSSNLAAGVKFKTLASTTTITAINGATISAPFTDVNNAGQIKITGPAATDTVEMRKASDNSLIATRTGPGAFAVAPANVGVSVYFERKVGAVLVMSTQTAPVTLATVNEDVPMFAGPQVAVANIDGVAKESTLLTRASQASVDALASTNQTEHDATQSAIAAIQPVNLAPVLTAVDALPTLAEMEGSWKLTNGGLIDLGAFTYWEQPNSNTIRYEAFVPFSDGIPSDSNIAGVVDFLGGLASLTADVTSRTRGILFTAVDAPNVGSDPSSGPAPTLTVLRNGTPIARGNFIPGCPTMRDIEASEVLAKKSDITALPAPLNSTQTQAAAAAALVAYDAVVPADLAGLATSANVTAAQTAIIAEVDAIPTNPLLTTDSRLNNLDAAISTRSTLTAPQVRAELATELGRLDVAVGTRLSASAYVAPTTAPTAADNAAAVRTNLTTELARIDATVSSRLATTGYTAPANADIATIKAKTDTLVNGPTLAEVEASAILAKEATVSTRASQTSVNAIPTNPLLTNDARVSNLDATVSSRATQTSVNALGTPAQATALATLASTNQTEHDATQATLAALPDAAVIATAVRADIERAGGMLDTVPTLPEMLASTLAKQADLTGLATAANVTNAQTAIVGEINANETKIDAVKADTAAIKAKTDTLVNTVAPTPAQIRAELETTGSKLDTAAKKSKAVWVNTL